MNHSRSIIFVFTLYFLWAIYACSSEPANTEECIEKYMTGVRNDKAAGEIDRACRGLFDADTADDRYYRCVLNDMTAAETDKDVNIILRRCTMKNK